MHTTKDYIERRLYSDLNDIEIRTEEGKQPEIFGYGSVFNKQSRVLRSPRGERFVEIIKPGAFDHLLNDERIVILFNHDANYPIGRNKRSASIGVDNYGLWYRLAPPNSPLGQNIEESIKRGDVIGSSFSFIVAEENEQWERRKLEPSIRTITKVDAVFDLGPVVFEAYPDALVTTRNYSVFENNNNHDFAEMDKDLMRLDLNRLTRKK